MEQASWVPSSVDLDRPSAARMYDYFLGGSHNFAVDREAAKSVEPHPTLPGTIVDCVEAIRADGGTASWFQLDVRDIDAVEAMIQHAPDEHLLESVAREGLAMIMALFTDLGTPGQHPNLSSPPLNATALHP